MCDGESRRKASPTMTDQTPDWVDAIQRERDYQDGLWGTIDQNPHSVEEWLLLMREELNEAMTAFSDHHGDDQALKEIVQVVALGVACLEQHGVVERSRGTEKLQKTERVTLAPIPFNVREAIDDWYKAAMAYAIEGGEDVLWVQRQGDAYQTWFESHQAIHASIPQLLDVFAEEFRSHTETTIDPAEMAERTTMYHNYRHWREEYRRHTGT